MKRLFTIPAALLMLCSLTGAAKGTPEISFASAEHDFGTVSEAKGPVTCTFTYTNSGSAPLALTTVSAPCGCTKPEFSAKPLAPGKKEKIMVTFNPEGIAGEFMRTITVRTNIKNPDGKKKKVTLKISGVVIPKK